MTTTRLLFPIVVLLLLAGPAQALERNFAGSAQLDYHVAPTEKNPGPNRSALDGFTTEVALKVAVDVTDRLSANVKVCHGCHGFELPMAYFDFRVTDWLNVRAGRFSPSFGSFNLRHDPANHVTSDKPLPYDMGRMLRWASWNLGVLPSPFPDNGVELGGTHWFGERAQLDYAAYAVAGFRGEAGDTDLDWSRSMSGNGFLVDNNGRPTVGGRAALTSRVGDNGDVTVGGSVMHGTYDPASQFRYTIAGADFATRIGRTQLRLEYLVRRQTFLEAATAMFKEPRTPDGHAHFTKHGWYVEVERAMTDAFTLLLRADGLARFGNVPVDSPLTPRSAVFRYTVAGSYALEPGFRLKASVEAWGFSNDFPQHDDGELSMHVALVGSF